jgi:CRP-like cAMP-binding protein
MGSTPQDKVTDFFAEYELRSYRAGQHLIQPDQTPKGIFCLIEGNVRVYTISQDGVELTINIFKPISFFPVGWAINATENKYYYQAMSNSNCRVASKQAFNEFISREPDVVLDLLHRIYKGLDGYFLRMESLLSGSAYYKTIVHLIIQTRRFGQHFGVEGAFHLKLTQREIASLSGLTRETVSREIKKLQDREIISYEKGILTVQDLQKLERELLTQ